MNYKLENLPTLESNNQEEHWVSISDLMAGLMIVFLFIAIVYMIEVKKDKEDITDIATKYLELKNDFYNDLLGEFKDDLDKWNASLDPKSLSLRFKEPDVYFKQGKIEIEPKFMKILDDFFPRYVKILHAKKYRNEIEEIRIEGHTSSTGWKNIPPNQSYFKNMELSQGRTRSVLQYVLNFPEKGNKKDWLKKHLTANGLSSSKLILKKDGTENKPASRRVEFRVRINAERKMTEISQKTLKNSSCIAND